MNTKIHSVKYNFIMNAILTVSSFIFPLITFPYATRVLGVDFYGNVSFGQSVLSYFILISSLGIPTYGIRACAKVRDDDVKLSQTVKELLYINLIATIVSYVLFFISLFSVSKFYQNKEILLINSFSIILNTIGVQWLFSALEQYSYITFRNILFKIISIVLMFIFVKGPNDYQVYAFICVVSGSASNILNYFYMWKFVDFKKTGKCNFKPHLKPIFIFFASSAAINVFTSLDSTMLGFLTNDRQVGLYTASIRLKNVLVGLVKSLGTVLLPRMSYYIEKGEKEQYTNLLSKSFNFILVISIPLTLFFILFAKDCLIFISGSEYADAALSMQLIMPTIICIGFSSTIESQIMIPYLKENVVCFAVWVSAIMDFILNLFLIPKFGAAGASFATLIAEATSMSIQFYYARDEILPALKKVKVVKIIGATVITMLLVYFISSLNISNLFVSLCVNAISFFGAYFVFLLVFKEKFTYDIFISIFNRRKKGITHE